MSHTPGPWRMIANGRKLRGDRGMAWDILGNCSKPPESQEIVCDKATEDDARLIAAAPDMFAALKAARVFLVGLADSELRAGKPNAAMNVRQLEIQIKAALDLAEGGATIAKATA